MTTNQMDPDVPILREALVVLQRDVAAGLMTPKAANTSLGKLADSLVANRHAAAFTTRRRSR